MKQQKQEKYFNEIKSWFFKRINKTDKVLDRDQSRKKRKTQITNIKSKRAYHITLPITQTLKT